MLILTGDKPTPLAKLARVPADIEYTNREPGKNWRGVKHSDLLKTLRTELQKTGRSVDQPTTWTTCNGGDIHACLRIVSTTPNYDHWIGVSASNVRRGRLRVYPAIVSSDGVRLVYECLVGARYTLTFDLQRECEVLAVGWQQATEKANGIRESLKRCPLSVPEAGLVILNAARSKCLSYRQIGKVETAFRESEEKTAWTLLRAYCTVATLPVAEQLSDLLKFYQIVARKLERNVA